MPLASSDFPEEVQVAFFMFSLLPDHYEGMSGAYMGKEWSTVEHLFNMYEVESPKIVHYIMKLYEGEIVVYRAQQAENRRKADERRAKTGGGKNFTHNVKG